MIFSQQLPFVNLKFATLADYLVFVDHQTSMSLPEGDFTRPASAQTYFPDDNRTGLV